MSPRLIIRTYTETRDEDTPSSPRPSSSPSGGRLAAAIVLPIILVISLSVVFTVTWRRRAQRRRAAESDAANTPQQPISVPAVPAPTHPTTPTTAPLPTSPSLSLSFIMPPPPPPPKSPPPAPEPPSRRPSLRERLFQTIPAIATRLSGGSGGTRGSGTSRADPVLPHAPPQQHSFFNSDDMLAPRAARPSSALQSRVIPLGPPLSPPPKQPLPPTPTSASVGGIPPKERGERSNNGKGKRKVRPLPPLPDPPKAPPPPSMPSLPVVLRPNRFGEPPLPQQEDLQLQEQEGDRQRTAVLLVPRAPRRDRGSDADSDGLPPPYTSPAYRTRSRT